MNVVTTISGTHRNKNRKKHRTVRIILALLFIIAVVCGIYYFKKGMRTNSNAALTRNLSSENIKTNIGLANFAWNALDCQSGYVFGAVGQTVTPTFLQQQARRFAGNSRANLVGSQLSTIYREYGGHPAFDCIGLIKAYSWIDEKTGEISSAHKSAMPDCSSNRHIWLKPLPTEVSPLCRIFPA